MEPFGRYLSELKGLLGKLSLYEVQNICDVLYQAYTHEVTGAGDAVVGTLALAVACGAQLEEAASVANFAAGRAVGKCGTTTVTGEELCADVDHHVGVGQLEAAGS